MKIFCSYAFTGLDPDQVVRHMRLVVDTLSAQGHTAYCHRFDPAYDDIQQQNDIKAIFQKALAELAECDAVVAIIMSPHRSVGQLIEIGAALAQDKPVYLFEHESAAGSTYLPQLLTKHFRWNTNDELVAALSSL